MSRVVDTTEINIVIGVAPTSEFSLETELRLIKPSLLYGDRVTLYSPATSLVAMAAAIGELTEDQKVDFLAQVVPEVSPEQAEDMLLVINAFRELRRKRRRTREEILIVEKVRRQLRVAWEQIHERMDEMIANSGCLRQGRSRSSALLPARGTGRPPMALISTEPTREVYGGGRKRRGKGAALVG